MGDTSHTACPQVIIIGDEGTSADVFTDQLSKKKALLTSYLEFLNTFSRVYPANQTNLAIITPGSGRRLCIHSVSICTEANAGDVELDFQASGIPVGRCYATRFQTCCHINMHTEGGKNEPLRLTTTTGANDVFIAVSYIEEKV